MRKEISYAIVFGLLLVLAASPQEASALGKWLEKQVTGDVGGQFWKNVEKAKPIIKQNADSVLRQLGYEPGAFASHVFFAGEGEEVWTVAYWRTPPENIVVTPRDVEAHLNIRGKVKRVAKLDHGQEQLIYGKDERIPNGFTKEEVRARLGDPDFIGPTPRYIRREIAEEIWKYKQNASRTMTIHVYFKDGKVSSVSYSGE